MSAVAGPVRSRWFKLIWVIPAVLMALAIVVLLARWLRGVPPISDLVHDYPGQAPLPAWIPVGFPAWLQWQHGLNVFFLLLIIRSGWQVRTQSRPAAYWTRNNNGWNRTKRAPTKISLMLWLHLSLDSLWALNGLLFYVLIFSTGQWARVVPSGWDIVPHAVSTAIQYASLEWPAENGWVNYNALQVLSYFLVVFVAAPLAIVAGLRMSPIWPSSARINRVYPVELARRVHFPTMIFFVLFLIAHVTLVLATGALNNLNHMYAGRNDESWLGFVIFAISLIVMVVAWIAARPVLLRPIAARGGKVTTR